MTSRYAVHPSAPLVVGAVYRLRCVPDRAVRRTMQVRAATAHLSGGFDVARDLTHAQAQSVLDQWRDMAARHPAIWTLIEEEPAHAPR